jgi:hypothetical protein
MKILFIFLAFLIVSCGRHKPYDGGDPGVPYFNNEWRRNENPSTYYLVQEPLFIPSNLETGESRVDLSINETTCDGFYTQFVITSTDKDWVLSELNHIKSRTCTKVSGGIDISIKFRNISKDYNAILMFRTI